jgi:hypothetical protein
LASFVWCFPRRPWLRSDGISAKLPEAAPLFEEFLRAVPLQIYRPTPHDRERARDLADAKDVSILAAAIGA